MSQNSTYNSPKKRKKYEIEKENVIKITNGKMTRKRKNRNAGRSKAKPKQKVSLKKLQRTHKNRDSALNSIGYDPKSVVKFGGIVG